MIVLRGVMHCVFSVKIPNHCVYPSMFHLQQFITAPQSCQPIYFKFPPQNTYLLSTLSSTGVRPKCPSSDKLRISSTSDCVSSGDTDT